jgi:hypothetical protein
VTICVVKITNFLDIINRIFFYKITRRFWDWSLQILPFIISSILFILVPSSLYLVLISLFSCVRFFEFCLNESTVWVTSSYLLRVICDWFSSSYLPRVYVVLLLFVLHDLTTSVAWEIGTISIYWDQQSRCPFTWWRRQTPVSETSCFLIKNRRR